MENSYLKAIVGKIIENEQEIVKLVGKVEELEKAVIGIVDYIKARADAEMVRHFADCETKPTIN